MALGAALQKVYAHVRDRWCDHLREIAVGREDDIVAFDRLRRNPEIVLVRL